MTFKRAQRKLMEKIICLPRLRQLWRGEIHLHTAFWLLWVAPMYALMVLGAESSSRLLDVAGLIGVGFTSVMVWRSAGRPPGAPWVGVVYRVAVGLFWVVLALVVGLTIHDFLLRGK